MSSPDSLDNMFLSSLKLATHISIYGNYLWQEMHEFIGMVYFH